MPALQTTYPEDLRAAIEGMVANSEPKNIISRTVETAAGAAFGRAVVQGAGDNGVIIPTIAGGAVRGITVRDVTLPQDNADIYLQFDDAGVMTSGVIWVTAQEAVSAGGPVSFLVTSGELFTTIDATHDAIPGAIWESSAAIGELAKVRLG